MLLYLGALLLIVSHPSNQLTALQCPSECRCDKTTSWTVHDYFKPVQNVTTQDCGNSQLTSLPLPIDDEVVILRINNNILTEINLLGFPKDLLVFNANSNQINRVTAFDAIGVRHLHLKDNKLKRIPITSPSVQYMNLNDNEIDSDPGSNLLFYKHLKRIDMKNNQLEYLPFLPSSLIEGYFNNNKLKFLNKEVLSKLTKLKNLFLNDNLLYKIDFPEAVYLSKISKLSLANNPYLQLDPIIKSWCENEKLKNEICKKAKDITIRTCA